jgi:hypothetical protein
MAFKTDSLAKAYAEAQNEAIRVKNYAQSFSSALAENNQSGDLIENVMVQMKRVIDLWNTTTSMPGMAQYARDQADDQAYDVVAEFNTMRNAAITVRDWIINNFPSAGGFIQKDTYEADGSITVRQFTPAQTAGLRTVLDSLVNAIETV